MTSRGAPARPDALYIPDMSAPRRSLALLCSVVLGTAACDKVSETVARLRGPDTSPPDSLPELLNDSLPFDYPPGLYLQLIDDSVTLRLHISEFGEPVPESIRVERGAKYAQFDSAALTGARELRFRPARRKGRAIPYTVLFPIQFKVPTVPLTPVPADSTRR
jgi:TonB family protein